MPPQDARARRRSRAAVRAEWRARAAALRAAFPAVLVTAGMFLGAALATRGGQAWPVVPSSADADAASAERLRYVPAVPQVAVPRASVPVRRDDARRVGVAPGGVAPGGVASASPEGPAVAGPPRAGPPRASGTPGGVPAVAPGGATAAGPEARTAPAPLRLPPALVAEPSWRVRLGPARRSAALAEPIGPGQIDSALRAARGDLARARPLGPADAGAGKALAGQAAHALTPAGRLALARAVAADDAARAAPPPGPLGSRPRDEPLRAAQAAAGRGWGPPGVAGGVSVAVGLPGGGPTRRQRERDRAVHAATMEMFARVEARRRRRADSLAWAAESTRAAATAAAPRAPLGSSPGAPD